MLLQPYPNGVAASLVEEVDAPVTFADIKIAISHLVSNVLSVSCRIAIIGDRSEGYWRKALAQLGLSRGAKTKPPHESGGYSVTRLFRTANKYKIPRWAHAPNTRSGFGRWATATTSPPDPRSLA